MGLDQYLTAKVYVGAKYRAVKQNYIEMQDAYGDDKDFADFKECKLYPTHNISEIIYDIGYWRKVNWIHKWFVDNVYPIIRKHEKILQHSSFIYLYKFCFCTICRIKKTLF